MVLLAAFAVRGRGWPQRALDLVTIVLATWTIIAACAFAGSTLKWLTVGEAFSLLALGILGVVLGQIQFDAAVRRALRRRTEPPAHPLIPATSLRRPHPIGDRR